MTDKDKGKDEVSAQDIEKISAHAWLHVGIGAGRPLDAECYEYAITAYKKNVVEKAAILIDFRCRDARLTYECARMAGEIAATRSRGRRIQLKAFKDACEQLPPLDRTKGMFCSGI